MQERKQTIPFLIRIYEYLRCLIFLMPSYRNINKTKTLTTAKI